VSRAERGNPITIHAHADHSCPNVIEPIGTPRFARGFGKDFRELVMNDAEITSRVPAKQIEQAFSIERQLRNVDKIFKRVFGQ